MEPIPEEIKRFLDEHVESVEQLEMLRVLQEDPERLWTAANLAKEIQTTPEGAAAHLHALQARGLLSTTPHEGQVAARHGPRAELAEPLAHLLKLYRERPVSMIKLVYARINERLKAFADAFRLRKEG